MFLNYYERHIGDYLKDTAHLSLLEHGVYSRLLDVYYTRETGIPVDQVERLIGARSKEERAALSVVLDEFFCVEDGVLRQARGDREIARYRDKQAKASASANARWQKAPAHTERSAAAMRTHSECNANGMLPVTSNQTPDSIDKEHATHVVETDVSPRCPHDEILALFAMHLPSARQPADWTPARQAMLRSRWREKPNRQNIEWWDRFFAFIAESKFLTGRANANGRQPFLISLDWILKPANFLKIIEGAYHTENV
jgi:uncharacterized protein YdaU (DUF1376 family)